MRKLLTLLFILTFLNSFGQTEMKILKYNLLYSDNNQCYANEYKFTFPHLIISDTNDVRKKVNDSIVSFAKSNFNLMFDGVCSPNFQFNKEDCDSIYLDRPEYTEMNYNVTQNTDMLLSLTISVHNTPGYGGHGGGFNLISFNIDIKRNKLFTTDDLFNETNKEKLLRLIMTKIEGFKYEDFQNGYISFLGININNKNIIAHFSGYHGNAVYHPIDVELPLTEIKKLINKNYLWLLEKN